MSFLLAPDGTFIAPPRVQSTLTKNGDGTYAYVLPDQRRLTFAASGRLERVADRNANTTTLGYDGGDRLTSITDPSGRSIQLTYNDDGQVASATDPADLTVNYGYASGNLVSVAYEDAPQPQWRFGYDGEHQLTSMTDGRGNTTTTSYDASNHAISQTDALDRTRTWEYLEDETRITNPGGDVTLQRFDANRQPVSTTVAHGSAAATTQTMSYDADLNLKTVTDGNGNTTTFIYDGAGNRTSATDANDDTTTWAYDGQRNVTSMTSASNRVTSFTYDARGNLTRQSRTLARPGQVDVVQAMSFDYDDRGQLLGTTDPLGRTWSYAYNDAGDQVSETSPHGAATTWTYDGASRVTSIVAPRGNAAGADPADFMTTIGRDEFGLPTDVRDPLGNHSTTAYDGNHNPIETVDAAARVTKLTYDAENQRTQVERAGLIEKTQYDANGRIAARTNAKDHATTYHRDPAGRVTSIVDPRGRETSQSYDPAGQLVRVTDALARVTNYDYDPGGQLTAIDYSSTATPDVSLSYDADGRRIEMTDGTGSSSYDYDSLDRLTSTTNGDGKTIGYGYDLADQQTTLTYPNGQTVTREYDASGRVESITDWLGNTTGFEYDGDSNHTMTRFPTATGNVDRYQHDPAGRLASIVMDGDQGQLSSLEMTRNGVGQLATTQSQGLPGTGETYDYDPFGRLSADNDSDYAYDPAGNPTKLGATDNLTYDEADELIQASTPSGVVNYAFDGVGNRTASTPATGPAVNYDYDQADRLTSVDRVGDPTIAYEYDGSGLRASKAKNSTTTKFSWDVSTDVPQLLSDGQNRYIFDPDGLPLERIGSDGAVSFFHHDQLGSTRVLTDEQGDVLGTYSYDPYGKPTASPGSAATAFGFGFAGEYTDSDTGLIYLRARYYDPATGQFLTRDPLEDLSGQPYLYAGGDPINSIDPLGLFPSLSEIGAAVSNAAAGALDGASFGYSTKLAASAFGFDAACADWGTGFGTGAALGIIAGAGKIRLAAQGGRFLDRVGVRLADEVGAVGRYGNLGKLASRADETVADVIRSRGGGASQINQLQTGYGQLTLGEISQLAAKGDREAVKAIKMAKQAGSQGKGGR